MLYVDAFLRVAMRGLTAHTCFPNSVNFGLDEVVIADLKLQSGVFVLLCCLSDSGGGSSLSGPSTDVWPVEGNHWRSMQRNELSLTQRV